MFEVDSKKNEMEEDDINEFLKQIEDETENLTESSNQINKTWINTAKDRGRWRLLEENYTKNSGTRTRRDWHNRPARYVNGTSINTVEEFQSQENLKERAKWCALFSESRSSSASSTARIAQ